MEIIVAREAANGTWFFLSLFLAFVLWRHLVIAVFEEGYRAYDSWVNRGIIGLAVYFTSSAIMRLWVWVLLIMERRGDDWVFLAARTEIPLLAASGAVIGAMCCVRVFTPIRWNPWFWLAVGVIALITPWIVHWSLL